MSNRILIVDDDAASLKLVTVVLKQAGYETFTATTGLEALSHVDEIRPDLIIADVEMRG